MDTATLVQQCYALIQAGEPAAGQQLYQAMMSGNAQRIMQESISVTKLLAEKAAAASVVATPAMDQGSSGAAAAGASGKVKPPALPNSEGAPCVDVKSGRKMTVDGLLYVPDHSSPRRYLP